MREETTIKARIQPPAGPPAGYPSATRLQDITARTPLPQLMEEAAALRDSGHGRVVTYSKKIFVPLTHLCRDVCHYCVFTRPPQRGGPAYLSPDQVLEIAHAGARGGCKEALFTLGDKPELRYRAAREALAALGYGTTIEYLAAMCALVRDETGLMPHVNPGVMTADEIADLRRVAVSQGLMLESASNRLGARGGPHFGSPDKRPRARLETIAAAGRLQVPLTSGILIGIGETREERLDALLALRELHLRHGHLQEIIVQNFRAKPGTKMADAPEPGLDELLWTVAMARIAFGAAMNIQAPPNLSPGSPARLIAAGINDWGGVSPVTPDHVNPEAPWPEIKALGRDTADAGKELVERLAVYPTFALDPGRWLDDTFAVPVIRAIDTDGFARVEDWTPGLDRPPPQIRVLRDGKCDPRLADIIAKSSAGARLDEPEITALFGAHGADFEAICHEADSMRKRTVGETVTYAVNRNVNYTNLCLYQCRFCAFSKGRVGDTLRGAPYDLDLDEIARRTEEAWERGATEMCLQGGIHPDYNGDTYLAILEAVKEAAPGIHVHAFSPLEVAHGAESLGLPVGAFLDRLIEAGLGSLPGTAAEILDDEVRRVLCPDKVSTGQWLGIVEEAHGRGLSTSSTIMFGHIEGPAHWARHLLALRDLQARTGGITEFVPLPFVHMEAPIYLAGRARKGPTFREAILMHAIARLALHPLIPNIQVSWVKMGTEGAAACLGTGANDLGGTLMNESISRAAGSQHGQEFPPEAMEALIASLDRTARQRTTLYGDVAEEQRAASFGAPPLSPVVLTPPARRQARTRPHRAAPATAP